MKTTQRGFIIPLLLIIAAIFLTGGGAYFYTQTKSENPAVTEDVTLPQATSTAQTQKSLVRESKSQVTSSIITSILGPKYLSIGQEGSWEMTAPGATRFSVIWADGTLIDLSEGSGIPHDNEFTANSRFSHAFIKAGTYHVDFFAKNSDSVISSQGFTVVVQAQTTSTAPTENQATQTTVSIGGRDVIMQFHATPFAQNGPLSISFSAVAPITSDEMQEFAYFVDFGDESSGRMEYADIGKLSRSNDNLLWSVTHTYSSPGTYIAKIGLQIVGFRSPLQFVGTTTVTVPGK